MKAPFVLLALLLADDCETKNSDTIQQDQQEAILREGTSAVGMPAIRNFRERRILKDILELRDQNELATFTYTFAEGTGKISFFCNSIGYAVPYSTQYTNPRKIIHPYSGHYMDMPQADPNGLFSPDDAEGSWVMCKDPNGDDVRPVYIEPRVIVSPFKLQEK